jgi:glycosyltransferase involved in cell wall biosynthesis
MKITLITVVRNNENTIENTIKSILSQKYKDIEYIIIDGASTDGTIKVINKYKKNINKFVTEPDRGIYDALNKGINISTGEIIGFLHADDWYPRVDILTNVSNEFTDNKNLDIIWGDVAFVNAKNERIRYCSGKNINFNIGIMPPHPSVFIKRQCYEKYGAFNINYRIAADYDLLYRLIVKYKLITKYSKRIIVNMSPLGISNKNLFSKYILNSEVCKIHKHHNNSIKYFDIFKKYLRRIKELKNQKVCK